MFSDPEVDPDSTSFCVACDNLFAISRRLRDFETLECQADLEIFFPRTRLKFDPEKAQIHLSNSLLHPELGTITYNSLC